MKSQVIILLCVIGASSAWWSSSPAWNDLKVTWGLNPFSNYNSMPRTVKEAEKAGFVKIGACADMATHRGNRYQKKDDDFLVLLYDLNGYIAGIQAVIPDDMPHNYPAAGEVPPFVKVGNKYILTAYFSDPVDMCTSGRSRAEYDSEGTGNRLLIQNGNNPEKDLMSIPMNEKDLVGSSWVKGKCFKTMGMHYWYKIDVDMNCDDFFPVFILYNGGKLDAFGWAIEGMLPSARLEHPEVKVVSNFIREVPKCLSNRPKLSTMHIYLTGSPLLDWC